MRRQAGFTLIELLITISVVGLLVAVAVPNFKTTIQNNRLVSQGNDLLGAFLYARSQAISLSKTVTVCASSDGASCSTDWSQGWIICQEAAAATTDCSGSSTILRKHEALSGSNTVYSSLGGGVSFVSSGQTVAGTANGYINICDSRGANYGRSLWINSTGFTRLSTTPGKKLDGTSLSCTS